MVIEINNIYKRYQLGIVSTGTLSYDLARFLARIFGKDDPTSLVTTENKLKLIDNNGFIWALQDINLQIDQGEILGIIGRNGAGKSTLLKIISRITAPTKGEIRIKGKVGSLLEVGTGFHPELTGKENIFLNGSILGMAKNEINRKLEAIIDFSDCERYIDTPVKRYSTGMKVRLAFSVAAYLEPDILLVDEVLAVGDYKFQKKAMDKIKDISLNKNSTILFVSHNLNAVRTMTKRCILLENGKLTAQGNTSNIIDEYVTSTDEYSNKNIAISNEHVELLEFKVLNKLGDKRDIFKADEDIVLQFVYKIHKKIEIMRILFQLIDKNGMIVFTSADYSEGKRPPQYIQNGVYCSKAIIPGNLLNTGYFSINISSDIPFTTYLFKLDNVFSFEINNIDIDKALFNEIIPGPIAPPIDWSLDMIN